nr:hypothetical protein [Candidatus Bipolaricaulota bacterium]
VAVVADALAECARRIGCGDDDFLDRLLRGDHACHSQLRYATAKRIAEHLGRLGGGLCGVFVYGSTMTDQAVACSDIDLLVVIERKSDQAKALIGRIDLALSTGFRSLLPGCRTPDSLLDIHLLDEDEVQTRRGYGAVLNSVQASPVCLWRTTPRVREGLRENRSPSDIRLPQTQADGLLSRQS